MKKCILFLALVFPIFVFGQGETIRRPISATNSTQLNGKEAAFYVDTLSDQNIFGEKKIKDDLVLDSTLSIGVSTPDGSAILDVASTTKGFIPPRMTETQRDAIGTPTEGLQIHDNVNNVPNFYNGTAWRRFSHTTAASLEKGGVVISETSNGSGIFTDSANFLWDNIAKRLDISSVTLSSGGHLILPTEDDAVTPTLSFGNGNTGFYERVDNDLRVSVDGVNTFLFFQTQFRSAQGTGPAMVNLGATSFTPTLIPDISNANTGIGQAAEDQLSLIAGGVEGQRITETAGVITHKFVGSLGVANSGEPQYRLDIGNTSYFAINGDFAHIIQHNNVASTFWSIAPRNGGDLDIAVTTTDPRPTGSTISASDNAISIKANKDVDFAGAVTASNLNNLTLIEDRSPSAATTTSATYVTLISSASTTFSGRPVLVFLHTSLLSTIVNTVVEFAIQIDSGSDVEIGKEAFNIVSTHQAVTGALIITPTAGSHTINLRWRRGTGTGTLTYDTNDQILVHAIEL